MLYLLDTDIASYIIKSASPAAESKLASIPPDQVTISVITRAELLYGLRKLPATSRLRMTVRQFLATVRILAWEAPAADSYAEIRHQLTQAGKPIGELDTMIAAHALALGATLVTNNICHYAQIAGPLRLENWSI